MKSFRVSKNLARYDFCSNKKEWQLAVRIDYPGSPRQGVFELWPEDGEPDIDDLSPLDAIDKIKERLDSYWYCGRKEECKPFFDWVEENRTAIEKTIAKERIEDINKEILDLQQEIIEIEEKYLQNDTE